jgi:hypothetical protein
LLHRIAESFPVPKPEDIHVHLKTDAGKGEDKYHQQAGDKVLVQ